jgi:hypothetical protein
MFLVLTATFVGAARIPARAARGDQLHSLTAADANVEDYFGISVALTGNYALVGAPYDDDRGNRSGAAYLFDVATGEQIRKLIPDDGASGAAFGKASADGDRALIASPFDLNIGSVYLFDLTTGEQTRKLVPTDGEVGDGFGNALALSGDLAVVGSPNKPPGVYSGAVYVFDAGTGDEIGRLAFSDLAAGDQAGISVAIDKNRIVVGAPFDDDRGASSGAVYFFDARSRSQIAKVSPADGEAAHFFGVAVDVSNGVAVIGAPNHSGAGQFAGAAYLYNVNTAQEMFQLRAHDADPLDFFGTTVAIDGGIAVVGCSRDDTAGPDAGAAYLFDVSTGMEIGKLVSDDADPEDRFGSAVALGGGRVLVGAPFHEDDDLDAGKAYLFDAGNAVPVRLAAFSVKRTPGGATVAWEVAEAHDHAGFFVYRERAEGTRERVSLNLLSGRRSYEFFDSEAPPAGARYWLAEVGRTGKIEWHGPVELAAAATVRAPLTITAAPNPFVSSTTVTVSAVAPQMMEVDVFDLRGRRVRTLATGGRVGEDHRLIWDGTTDPGDRAPRGVYLIRARVGLSEAVYKVILAGG